MDKSCYHSFAAIFSLQSFLLRRQAAKRLYSPLHTWVARRRFGRRQEKCERLLNPINESRRFRLLRRTALAIAAILFLKVFAETVYEYRWYFPVNFDESHFLIGRRGTFFGTYRAAFFAHIISGPVVIVLGSILMLIGGRRRFAKIHRTLGRLQMLLVIGVVVPSGFIMALQAYTGAIAASGFAAHAIATGITAFLAIHHALKRRFPLHQRWATRCFILLCSPLLLRVISGATIVMQVDSDWTYRLTAWVSWLLPLGVYEWWWRRRSSALPAAGQPHSHTTKEAIA